MCPKIELDTWTILYSIFGHLWKFKVLFQKCKVVRIYRSDEFHINVHLKNIINKLHFQHQWLRSRGKCGVCGDPWGQRPRNHEAPGGRYANGIIVKEYRVGETMEVEIDLSANHRGSFTFKLCQNNNVRRDSHQRCFDRYVNSGF